MPNQKISFRGQRDGEEVILMLRRHPWAMAKPGLIGAAGLAIIIFAFVQWGISRPSIIILTIIGLAGLLYALYVWFGWWNTVYLLTDQRVIVVTQRGLLSRRIEDYSLEKIQSVASDTSGMAGTVLNFGAVMLAIMGIKEPVALSYIEDPYAFQERVLAARKDLDILQPLNAPTVRRKRAL